MELPLFFRNLGFLNDDGAVVYFKVKDARNVVSGDVHEHYGRSERDTSAKSWFEYVQPGGGLYGPIKSGASYRNGP